VEGVPEHRRITNYSFFTYTILLLLTDLILEWELRFNPEVGNLYRVSLASFIPLFIISLLLFRGLIYRIRYAFYGSVIMILLTILLFIFNGLYFFPYSFPLLAATLFSFYMLLRNHRDYNFPTRFFDKPEIAISLFIIFAIFLYGILGTLLIGDQFKPHIHDAIMALYYTGEVVTTLGFGDILPITHTAQIFTISLSLLGLGTIFGATTVIIAPFLYTRTRRVIGFLEKIESNRLEGYILFFDFSPLLESLLERLVAEKELVIIALDDEAKENRLKNRGAFLEIGKSFEDAVKSFDLRKARAIILSSQDDGRNVLNALYINSKYKGEIKSKVISLVNDPSNENKLQELVNSIIDPSVLVAERLIPLLKS